MRSRETIHGGLGPGNLGVVVARPSWQDSAPGRSPRRSARARRCSTFARKPRRARARLLRRDLPRRAITHAGPAADGTPEIERNRLIYPHLDTDEETPVGPGRQHSVSRIEDTVIPVGPSPTSCPTLIIDGFDFHGAARRSTPRRSGQEVGAETWCRQRLLSTRPTAMPQYGPCLDAGRAAALLRRAQRHRAAAARG